MPLCQLILVNVWLTSRLTHIISLCGVLEDMDKLGEKKVEGTMSS